jgi:hypothetical protein
MIIHELTPYLIKGELDNTIPGWVVGWMQLAGKEGPVTVKLKGDLERGFGEGKIRFWGKAQGDEEGAKEFMKGIPDQLTGKTQMMMAGMDPDENGDAYCLWWYNEADEAVAVDIEPDDLMAMIVPRKMKKAMWWL